MKRSFKPLITAQNSNEPALFHGWKEWEEGHYVIGEYLSSFKTSFRGSENENFRVRVHECNFTVLDKKEGKHVDPTDQILVLNGVGALNKFMEKVEKGMLVEVIYGGKKPGKDGTLYHTFDNLAAGYEDQESASDSVL